MKGSRVRALASEGGEALSAFTGELADYRGDVYRDLPSQLFGGERGRYLEEYDELVARASRLLEPFIARFVREIVTSGRPERSWRSVRHWNLRPARGRGVPTAFCCRYRHLRASQCTCGGQFRRVGSLRTDVLPCTLISASHSSRASTALSTWSPSTTTSTTSLHPNERLFSLIFGGVSNQVAGSW